MIRLTCTDMLTLHPLFFLSLFTLPPSPFFFFFFFNDTATTEIYTLSLHDALPICDQPCRRLISTAIAIDAHAATKSRQRSEEHTSELQSRQYLVCRLLLEKKKKK